jgi:hypothetical protein
VKACRALPCVVKPVRSCEFLSPHGMPHMLKLEQKHAAAALLSEEPTWEQQDHQICYSVPHAVAFSGWGQRLCSSL